MNNDLTIEQYGELCMAHARGEEMEHTDIYGTTKSSQYLYDYDDAKKVNWRINPKPKPKTKLYLWAVKYFGGNWSQTAVYLADEQIARTLYFDAVGIKRLDWSMIEVEQ